MDEGELSNSPIRYRGVHLFRDHAYESSHLHVSDHVHVPCSYYDIACFSLVMIKMADSSYYLYTFSSPGSAISPSNPTRSNRTPAFCGKARPFQV